MSTQRTLRIPDAVISAEGADEDTMFYGGTLQAENGLDVKARPLPEDFKRDELLADPLPSRPTGEHPDRALKSAPLGG